MMSRSLISSQNIPRGIPGSIESPLVYVYFTLKEHYRIDKKTNREYRRFAKSFDSLMMMIVENMPGNISAWNVII